jgi:hypothetical protein
MIEFAGREYYTARNQIHGNTGYSPLEIGDPTYVPSPEGIFDQVWVFEDGGVEIDRGERYLFSGAGNYWSLPLTGDAMPRQVLIYITINHNSGVGASQHRISVLDKSEDIIISNEMGRFNYYATVEFTGNVTVRMETILSTSPSASFWLAGVQAEAAAFPLARLMAEASFSTVTPTTTPSQTASVTSTIEPTATPTPSSTITPTGTATPIPIPSYALSFTWTATSTSSVTASPSHYPPPSAPTTASSAQTGTLLPTAAFTHAATPSSSPHPSQTHMPTSSTTSAASTSSPTPIWTPAATPYPTLTTAAAPAPGQQPSPAPGAPPSATSAARPTPTPNPPGIASRGLAASIYPAFAPRPSMLWITLAEFWRQFSGLY